MSASPSILLVNPSCFHYPDWMSRVELKTSQVLLASYLAKRFDVTYEDFEISIGRGNSTVQIKRFERKVREYLGSNRFDILALSCWTSLSWKATMMVARIWRELYPDRLLVIGGYHPSARPNDFLTPDDLIDYVICGEGELALEQIAKDLYASGRPAKTTFIQAPTFQPEQFVGYNWSLIDSYVQRNLPTGPAEFCMYLSRGCPFACSFCMESLKDRHWRPYTVEQSMLELERANEQFKPYAIGIADACFGMRPGWRKEFLRALVERKPSYWVVIETRPEYLDEEDISLLAQLKCEVQFGLESCSPRMLRLMQKTKTPEKYLQQFRYISHLLTEHEVLHRANLILNHPGETRETLNETFSFIDQELKAANSYLMWAPHGYMHFPGCDLDRNRVSYERQFGSRVNRPEWWKQDADQYEASMDCVPSSDLDNGDVDLWKRMFDERDAAMKESLAPRAFRFAAVKYYQEWQRDYRY